MTTTINASTSAGLINTADTSGVLALQTANTTAVSISASQVVTLTNALPVTSGGTGVTTSTGTGAVVLGTSPTITTPTISSLSSASATALTLQSAGTNGVIIDTSQNLQFNSGYGSVATAYGCRAWVNFNGTGTVAIRASGNVSSITDNGTGDYTVNFTTSMPDVNYSGVAIASYSYSVLSIGTAPTTSAFRFIFKNPVAADGDSTYVMVAVFR